MLDHRIFEAIRNRNGMFELVAAEPHRKHLEDFVCHLHSGSKFFQFQPDRRKMAALKDFNGVAQHDHHAGHIHLARLQVVPTLDLDDKRLV